MIKLDVIGVPVTLSAREAEELRDAATADAGRSTARRDLALLLTRALEAKTTVALSRAESRELVQIVDEHEHRENYALLRDELAAALENQARRDSATANQPPH